MKRDTHKKSVSTLSQFCDPLSVIKLGKGPLPQRLVESVEAKLKGRTFRSIVTDLLNVLKTKKMVLESSVDHRTRMVSALKEYAFKELEEGDTTNAELMGWTEENFERFKDAKLIVNTSPHASFNTPTPNELKYELANTLMAMNKDVFLLNTTLTTNTLLETKYNPRHLILDGRSYQLVKDLKRRGNQIMLRVETSGIDSGAEMLLREFIKAYKLYNAIEQKFSSLAGTKGLNKLHQQGDQLKASALPSGVMRSILDHGTPELNALRLKNLAYASAAFKARIFRKLFPNFKNRWMELPLDIVIRGSADILSNIAFLDRFQGEMEKFHHELKSKGFTKTGLEPYIEEVALEGERLGKPSLFRYITRHGYLKDLFLLDRTLFVAGDLKSGIDYSTEALSQGLKEGYLFAKIPLLLYAMHLIGIDVMIGGLSQAGSYHQMLKVCDAAGLKRSTAYANVGRASLKPMPKPTQLPPKGISDISDKETMWEADLLSYHLCGKGRTFLEHSMDITYDSLIME